MDEHCGKPVSGVGFVRRQSSITLQDSVEDRRRRRLRNLMCYGLTTDHKSTKTIVVDHKDRLQFSRKTLYSRKKDTVDVSFLPLSLSANLENTQEQGHNASIKLESNATTSGFHDVEIELENLDCRIHHDTPVDASSPAEMLPSIAHPKHVEQINCQTDRCNLRNLKCTSIPGFLLPGSSSSSSDSAYNRAGTLKRTSPNHEDSASRDKSISGCSNFEISGNSRSVTARRLSNHPLLRHTLRSTNQTSSRDGISVRTWRARNREVILTQSSLEEASIREVPSSTEVTQQLSSSNNSTRPRQYVRERSTQNSQEFLVRDGNQHFSTERIAQQLLLLENNLFLRGFGGYDQHRDMRLDIDNMSYEELLALEEKIGIVSTALSEEALSKCLKTHIYVKTCRSTLMSSCGDDNDTKCSICQEEYDAGDEIGKLECSHLYHTACISEWLRMKNWCPVCKASCAHAVH